MFAQYNKITFDFLIVFRFAPAEKKNPLINYWLILKYEFWNAAHFY